MYDHIVNPGRWFQRTLHGLGHAERAIASRGMTVCLCVRVVVGLGGGGDGPLGGGSRQVRLQAEDGAAVSLVCALTSCLATSMLCCAVAGHWTEDMRTDALVPAKLDNPNLKVISC